MSFLRGADGSSHNSAGARTRVIRPNIDERRDTRAGRLCDATLACARCDAPVSAGGRALSIAESLVCPFCAHRAPVRDFLSLAMPTRPAHVVVRISRPG